MQSDIRAERNESNVARNGITKKVCLLKHRKAGIGMICGSVMQLLMMRGIRFQQCSPCGTTNDLLLDKIVVTEYGPRMKYKNNSCRVRAWGEMSDCYAEVRNKECD